MSKDRPKKETFKSYKYRVEDGQLLEWDGITEVDLSDIIEDLGEAIAQAKTEAKIEVLEEVLKTEMGQITTVDGHLVSEVIPKVVVQKMLSNLKKKKK